MKTTSTLFQNRKETSCIIEKKKNQHECHRVGKISPLLFFLYMLDPLSEAEKNCNRPSFAGVVGFPMVGLKTRCCLKKIVLGGTLLKHCKCILIFRNFFSHHEFFDVTNSRLVLTICIVYVVIFIQKYLVNLFRISFGELLKILLIIL